MNKSMLLAVAMIAASIANAPAYAQEVHRVAVPYADLDLSRAEDAQILVARVQDAAKTACGGSPRFDENYRLGRHAVQDRFDACVDDAMATAMARFSQSEVQNAFGAVASSAD